MTSGLGHDAARYLVNCWFVEFRGNHFEVACPWYEREPYAPVLLDDPGHGVPAALCLAELDRYQLLAIAGSPPGHPLLRLYRER